jgi:hypothetical protein
MQDHIRLTANVLPRNQVNVLPSPAVSLDMNPIEHIWDELGRRVKTNHQIDNVNDLARLLQVEPRTLPKVLIRRYVHSMKRRILACIAISWGHTRYLVVLIFSFLDFLLDP